MKKSRAIVVSMVLGGSGAAFAFSGAAFAFSGAAFASSGAAFASSKEAFAQDPAVAPRATGRATERAPAQSRVRQEVKEGQLGVVRTVDAKQWQPGAPITMQIIATAPEGASLQLPELGSTFGPFDVRPSPSQPASPQKSSVVAELVAWEAGPLEVPAITVSMTSADGTKTTATVPATSVTLTSLIGSELPLTELASEIRGPVEIDTRAWWWWAIAAGATVAAGAFVWWLMRRPTQQPVVALVAPGEWARREFDLLESQRLPERGDVEGFFVRLSDVVRTYVERRYQIAAPDQTTQEFLSQAAHHPDLAGDHERTLGAFLRSADMVKFAAARPASDTCAHALTAMRGFVERTAPPPSEGEP